jgi:Tol biopolymer transport system component
MRNELIGQKAHASKHDSKLLTGSTNDKYAVVMDNGKTIVFISDRSKEAETRLKYQMRFQHVNVK